MCEKGRRDCLVNFVVNYDKFSLEKPFFSREKRMDNAGLPPILEVTKFPFSSENVISAVCSYCPSYVLL